MPKKPADAMLKLVKEIHTPLFVDTSKAPNWPRLEADAKMIEQRVKGSGSYLSGSKESLALSLGMRLGAMNRYFEKLGEKDLDETRAQILAFLPARSKDRVEEHVGNLRTRDNLNWGSSLLTLVSRELKQLPPDSM